MSDSLDEITHPDVEEETIVAVEHEIVEPEELEESPDSESDDESEEETEEEEEDETEAA
jgi:hypothetical protein